MQIKLAKDDCPDTKTVAAVKQKKSVQKQKLTDKDRRYIIDHM